MGWPFFQSRIVVVEILKYHEAILGRFKRWLFSEISKINIPNITNPELQILNKLFTVIMGGKIKLQVQDSKLEYLF